MSLIRSERDNAMNWLVALETTILKQGCGRFGNEEIGFCCMGIGAQQLNISFYANNLRSDEFEVSIGLLQRGVNLAIHMNDVQRKTFREIAQFIRKYPAQFFSWATPEDTINGL